MKLREFPQGVAILGDSRHPDVVDLVHSIVGACPLVIADPPYGNIVGEDWDKHPDLEKFVAGMVKWTRDWATLLFPGGAFYVWGGIGKVGFRPFYAYILRAEVPGQFELANHITWSKKRGYGVQNNYLFTREECAYFVAGDAKKPRTFNVPHLEAKRDYPGYDPAYPAKSEHYRRTNVWMDITEIFRGKEHPTQKAQRVIEVPIEVHTNPGEWVVDPFAGSGVTAWSAIKLGRKFVVVENDEKWFSYIVNKLERGVT